MALDQNNQVISQPDTIAGQSTPATYSPAQISSFYQSIMGAAPAQDTLNYYLNDLNNNGKTFGDLSNTLNSFVKQNGAIGNNFNSTPQPQPQQQIPDWASNLSNSFNQFFQQQQQPPAWVSGLTNSLGQLFQQQSQQQPQQPQQPPPTSNGGLGGLGGMNGSWNTGGWGNQTSPVYHPNSQPTNGWQGWGQANPFAPTF